MKKFFTEECLADNKIFLQKEEADKYISKQDLISQNKKTTYKGVNKYEYREINLFPFEAYIDFNLNEKFPESEKKRLSIHTKGKTIDFITLVKKVESKNGFKYTCVAPGDYLNKIQVLMQQKGLRGRLGDHYYEMDDISLLNFWMPRGYKVITIGHRVSFMNNIIDEDMANKLYQDLYEFDQHFKKK